MDSFDLTHFNSGTQKEADFLANFIARHEVLQFFLAQLRNTKDGQAAKHHLIIAPRGYGKTSLLRRIKIALREEAEFNARYIPLAFREEQHNVISLDLFWRNCLQSLLETREDEKADPAEIDELDRLWQKHAPRSDIKREAQDGVPAYAAFSEYCRKLGRRPVLLIDNLDSLLAGLEKHDWGLRAVLQKPDGPVLIAATSRHPDSLSDHKAAFFDFFRITTLPPLSDHEVMSCLSELARKRGARGEPVRRMLENDPGRISALNTMAGGNPRTLGVLYTVLEAHMSDDVLAQLSAMLDTFTGWYQARTEELPLQSRAVFDALALNWDPMTAADIGKITGLDTPTVSSHLSRLEKSGYAETVSLSKTKKSRNGYQVSERFFNIWYLMRNGPRRTRQAIRFLTVFLRSCFSRKELHEMAKDKLRNGIGRVESTLALAASIGDRRLRSRLLDTAENCLAQLNYADEARSLLHEMRKETKPRKGLRASGASAQAVKLLQEARQHISDNKLEKAESACRKAIALNEKWIDSWGMLGFLLHFCLNRYEEAETAYRKAIALDEKDARPWKALGDLLLRLNRYDEAETACRQAISLDGKDAYTWGSLGDLLQYHLKRYEEAEAAYRQAIFLDGTNAHPWGALGDLLQDHLKRYEEAETSYRQAIAIDEKWPNPWIRLADLLQYRLKRYEEAEIAYRHAITLDDKHPTLWGKLGHLLQYHLKQYQEAEAAYRQAIALDGKDIRPWAALGDLLHYQLERYEEAEATYRHAIALDKGSARPWSDLGNLLQYRLRRYEEAEAAYRKAIALDGKRAGPWGALGDLLQDHLERYEEAEAAYRNAIALDGEWASPWGRLGDLFMDYLERYEEAEDAYRQAIALDGTLMAPWARLGSLLWHYFERHEEAETAYRQAIALDDTAPRPLIALGNLLQDHFGRYEEAEAMYRRAISLDENNAGPWSNLGNLLYDFLGRYEDAFVAYKQGLAIDPHHSALLGNTAYLCALHLGKLEQARNYARQAESGLSLSGKNLLSSMLAWSDGGADAASRGWSELHQAVSCEDDALWSDYFDDLQRILAYSLVREDGEAVRKRMVDEDYPVKYAPLFHAYCAALDGEDHLLSINPEVRGMAEKIYNGLARMVGLFKHNQASAKHKRTKAK